MGFASRAELAAEQELGMGVGNMLSYDLPPQFSGEQVAAVEDSIATIATTRMMSGNMAYDKFDFEKAGWIEPREMPLLMVALGMHLNPSMVDTCLREMDSNCNGKIEFDEFFNWFEKEAERGTDAAMNGTRNRDGP